MRAVLKKVSNEIGKVLERKRLNQFHGNKRSSSSDQKLIEDILISAQDLKLCLSRPGLSSLLRTEFGEVIEIDFATEIETELKGLFGE